jgi:benzoate/toluate 1,2-dioxygenase reductase subunit
MTDYQVALAFEDGITQFINCRDTQTIADASYLRGINIPLDCTDGVCGTCKAFCESGTYDIGSHLQDALDEDEKAAGYMLPCVTTPRSDLVLQIACTSEVAKTQAASYTGTLVELQRLSSTTVLIEVEIPNRAELTFLPGQYVNIAVPGTDVTRSYSFSNAPNEERLTFLVKLTPGGAMSTYLTDRAAVGDGMTFTGPHGSFFLRESEDPLLLLAGGTGLAPILSILRKLHNDGSGRKTHVIYGVNTDEDLVALDEIAKIAAEGPGLTWDYCVTDPGSTAANKGPEKAYVMSLISPEHLHDGAVAVYTCGPPPMVDAVRRYFVDVDTEPIGFYYEKFALAAPAPVEEAPVEQAPVEQAPVEQAPVEVVAAAARPAAWREALQLAPDARTVAGQVMLPYAELSGWPEQVPVSDEGDKMRRIAGQLMGPTGPSAGAVEPLDEDGEVVDHIAGARTIAGQEMFPSRLSELAPVLAPPPAVIASDGYQIGEEHPGIDYSDALFTAREALELGALELTIGRLTHQQLTGYRLLAEATVPWIRGDRIVDAAMWTETNSAFHDYLFTLTGNEHLLQAYHVLGVKGRMTEVLCDDCWIDPLSAQDHLDIVDAFVAGDRDAARALIIAHSERARETMRRAMADQLVTQ